MITDNEEAIISKIKAHLADDDADAAYAVFKPLTKAQVFAVGYQIIGRTGYDTTKREYLSLLRECLPLMTATACQQARHEKELWHLASRHREHSDALAARKRLLDNGTITSNSTAFISWNNEGVQMHLADCIADYERKFVALATSSTFPIPENIKSRYPELMALIQPIAA